MGEETKITNKFIHVVKHKERRNGVRTEKYWCIKSANVYCHWLDVELPRNIRRCLNKLPRIRPWSDTYGIKNGRFEIETSQTNFSQYYCPDYGYRPHYLDFNLIKTIKIIEKFK